MSRKNGEKKEKPKYIDDGSTVVDMTDVRGGKTAGTPKPSNKNRGSSYRPRATFKEQLRTYIESVKMMFVPMLVVIAGICVLFLLLWLFLILV